MKAKRIAEITANIVDLKNQFSTLSDELKKEHGEEGAALMIAQAIIAREIAKVAMLYAELSAVISTPEKKNSDQLRKKQEQEDKEYLINPRPVAVCESFKGLTEHMLAEFNVQPLE